MADEPVITAPPIPSDADRERTLVEERIRAALGGVVDPCCRERGISVLDMGLLSDVSVHDGTAQVEIMLTSGWCPFQVDLVSEITSAATSVPGVQQADVRITLQQVWSPERMSPAARRSLRLLPDPGQVADRDEFLARSPGPRPFAAQEA